MRHTITALVEKPIEAQYLIEELTARCMADRSDISLIAQENSGQVSRVLAGASRAAGEVAGAVRAAAAPGSSLLATAVGTLEELARTFVDIGIEQSLARNYADALRKGHILIVVDAKTDAIAQCARQVMAKQRVLSPASG